MTNREYVLSSAAVIAIIIAVYAWTRWSRAEEVARYYRSDNYRTCMETATKSGASTELALYRCRDDDANVRLSQQR